MAEPVLDQDPSGDDPQSGIASILQQMQAAADRSRPPPLETVQNANPPTTSNFMTPDELIRQLLMSAAAGSGGGPMSLTGLYRRR